MTQWVKSQVSRLIKERERRVFLAGLDYAWSHPEVLCIRRAHESSPYTAIALDRVVRAAPELPDIDNFFAVVMLNSVGNWSATMTHARPAAHLVIDDRGCNIVARELARVVLNFTQDAAKGRPSGGVALLIRDLGVRVSTSDETSIERMTDELGLYSKRQVKRMRQAWDI